MGLTLVIKFPKELGTHDIIVHCVGGALGVGNPLADYFDWMKVWRFNVGIAIEINNVFINPLVKKRWGRVIHVSSISAIDGDAKIAYAASKSYLNSYTKGMSKMYSTKNIIFSGVMPGPLLTPGKFWSKQMKSNPNKVKNLFKNIIQSRDLQSKRNLSIYSLLASQHSSYASGALINLDGGKY